MKKDERRSLWYAGCALGIALGCAALASVDCTSTSCSGADSLADCTTTAGGTGGTGGAGATGGSAGSAGASTGGSAGAGGSAGSGGDTDASGPTCGGFAGLRCPDPDVTFCDYDEKAVCGEGDQTGICRPRPNVCTKDCPGVCGCDGKFYCNACEAQKAGTDDHPMGTCSDAGP